MSGETISNADLCRAGSDEDGCYVWHWHISLYRELERLAAIGEHAANIPALAGNLRAHSGDVNRWADDLKRAGLVDEAAPLWDYPARWIRLTSPPRS